MKRFVFFFLLGCFFSMAQTERKHEVYFETDKYAVSETELSRLTLFIQDLQNNDVDKITIYGFCDDRGSDSYNLKLSQERADAIKTIFSEHEMDNSLFGSVDGKGEIHLKIIENSDTKTLRSLNRKVEIIAYVHIPPRPEVINEQPSYETTLQGDLKVGDKVVLENILFKTGYSDILPESIETLERIAEILNERKDFYFTIQGHVCCTKNDRDAVDRKTKKRNLSEARARYIYYYLAKKGVSKNRMKYEGMRRKFPLGGDPKYDRRVEIVITRVVEEKK